MFSDEDRKKFDKAMDSISRFGGKIGIHINKKSSWVLKTLIISTAVLIFGFIILLWSILRKSVEKQR